MGYWQGVKRHEVLHGTSCKVAAALCVQQASSSGHELKHVIYIFC